MQNKYGASWKLLHSLHMIIFFIPVFAFIGFFLRKAFSGQKKWWVLAWIYTGLTVIAIFLANSGIQILSNTYMTIYTLYYFAMIIYACVSLSSYLKAVKDRREGGKAQPASAIQASPKTPSNPSTDSIVFTVSQDKQSNAAPSIDAIMQKIHELNSVLADEPMYPQLCQIETISKQILDYISENPEEQNSAHTFISYYLPEYSKILQNYVELLRTPVKTDKILKTMTQIQESLPKTRASFENLYNSLYSEKADDISTSINVLEKMMTQDGLTEDKTSDDSIHLQL